jgi:hypothetical protein
MESEPMMATGLDRLLARADERLAGRRYALLAHGASVTADLEPAHLALARAAGPVHPPIELDLRGRALWKSQSRPRNYP